ncbi:MAG TPA: response regulator [Anaerolineales bacterium]|nr:response regulator [Anaerolineales bacterium]
MGTTILIADDDLETLKLVGLILERQGFTIIAANNGRQAVAKIAAEKPALAIVDIMMPDMDGLDVTRRLRQEYDNAALPILLFTAKATAEEKAAGYAAGADDYLVKPTHPRELVARVQALLARVAQPPVSEPTGLVIGVIASRTPALASWLALNTAAVARERIAPIIMADAVPGAIGASAWLGARTPGGLGALLRRPQSEITREAVQAELIEDVTGLHVLAASPAPRDAELKTHTLQAESVLVQLRNLAPLTVLDLGTDIDLHVARLAPRLDLVLVVAEDRRAGAARAIGLIDALGEIGLDPGRAHLVYMLSANEPIADAAHELSLDPTTLIGDAEPQPMVVHRPTDPSSQQIRNFMQPLLIRLGLAHSG